MTVCPKCNKELSDDTKFCDGCGAEIFETVFCPNCGEKTSAEFAFCQSCGASIAEEPAEEAEVPAEEIPVQEEVEAPAEKKLPKKAVMFGAIGAAIIAVLIIVISLFSGGKAKDNYALYVKDGEIFFSDLKKNSEAWQLTSKLADSEEVTSADLAQSEYILGLYTYMSEDGKYLFFPDKIADDDEGLNLYFREVGKPKAEATKIDSGVLLYHVNEDATVVTYLKGEEGSLYQYQIGKDTKDKVASEVKDFKVSDDGKKLCYINAENSIYLKDGKKDKEKIVSEVTSLKMVSDDFSTLYYVKEDALYKQEVGKDKEKLASDVYQVLKIYESGEVYFTTRKTEEVSLMNYVIDDMKDTDATMVAPEYPEYPSSPSYPFRFEYDTNEEYEAAKEAYDQAYDEWEAECDRLEEEYNTARTAYWAKQSRDDLREELAERKMEQQSYTLCFFDGKEQTVISDAFIGDYSSDYTYASKAPVVIYEAYNQSSFEKVKLSEVESVYDLEDMVEAALFSSSERYIAVKAAATVVEQKKEADEFIINAEGTDVYYIDDIPDDKNFGELYHISITKGTVGKPELYDSDVYNGSLSFVGDDKIEYYKDFKDSKGELYISKTKIDYDVKVYSAQVFSDEDKVFYFTDWNAEKGHGTLKVFNGKEAVKIADEVHDFSTVTEDQVLYLYDYSMSNYKGELHQWTKGKTTKLDDDVVCILPVYSGNNRGVNYYGW